MPNWTKNVLTVATDCPEGLAAIELIKGALEEYGRDALPSDGCCFNFDKIVPMPELIKHTTSECSPSRGDFSRFSDRAYGDPHGDLLSGNEGRREFTEAEVQELARIGSRCWYDWCNKHWGTKWYGHRATMLSDHGGTRFSLWFETAWSPPWGVLQAIADRTGAVVVCSWMDEGEHYEKLYKGTFRQGVEPTEEIVEEETALI